MGTDFKSPLLIIITLFKCNNKLCNLCFFFNQCVRLLSSFCVDVTLIGLAYIEKLGHRPLCLSSFLLRSTLYLL